MAITPREIAEAFSGHDFEAAFPYLADDIAWRMPGSPGADGRNAVIALCRDTAAALADTDVERQRFLVVDGGDAIAIDTLTVYRDGDDVSMVGSCDVYEFADGILVTLTSYAVEA